MPSEVDFAEEAVDYEEQNGSKKLKIKKLRPIKKSEFVKSKGKNPDNVDGKSFVTGILTGVTAVGIVYLLISTFAPKDKNVTPEPGKIIMEENGPGYHLNVSALQDSTIAIDNAIMKLVDYTNASMADGNLSYAEKQEIQNLTQKAQNYLNILESEIDPVDTIIADDLVGLELILKHEMGQKKDVNNTENIKITNAIIKHKLDEINYRLSEVNIPTEQPQYNETALDRIVDGYYNQLVKYAKDFDTTNTTKSRIAFQQLVMLSYSGKFAPVPTDIVDALKQDLAAINTSNIEDLSVAIKTLEKDLAYSA
jgi:hypothetical protein